MKLLSGGQSGVDRAVLDVAIARGIDYGGWCPKDGWAEDFSAPPGLLAKYPHLKETPLADPAQRTEWNVRDADACMIVIAAGGLAVSKGTALAEEWRIATASRSWSSIWETLSPSSTRRCGCACSNAGLAPILCSPSAARARAKRRASMRSATAFIHALLDMADRG